MSVIAPPPFKDSLIDVDVRAAPMPMAKGWSQWLVDAILTRLQAAPELKKSVTLTTQTATIGATAVPMGAVPSGLYRVSWVIRVVTPAGVSSSLTVSIGWTRSGTTLSLSGAALTTNLTTSVQSGMVMIRADQPAPITYAVAYASNPAAAMVYELDVTVEAL